MELVTYYSNTPELLSDLRRTLQAVTELVEDVDDEPDLTTSAPIDRAWRLRDRLSPADIDQLIESFKAGTTIPDLAARYGICRTSVKTLLRQHDVRRNPRPDTSP